MGTYAESLLTPDERVLRRERQHPVALILDSWLAIILWSITAILILVKVILPHELFGRDALAIKSGELALAVRDGAITPISTQDLKLQEETPSTSAELGQDPEPRALALGEAAPGNPD